MRQTTCANDAICSETKTQMEHQTAPSLYRQSACNFFGV